MGIIDEAASLGLITLLDKLGSGTSKRVGFFLPGVNVEQVKTLLGHFSAKHGWYLIKEESQEGALIIIFQAGQWGLSISGSQRVYLALNQEQTGVRGAATSKSTMGQLVDRGSNQKNLDNLIAFLEQAISQPNQLGNLLSQPVSFAQAKSTINPKFFLILGLTLLAFFVFKIIIDFFFTMNIRNRVTTTGSLQTQESFSSPTPLPQVYLFQDTNPNNWTTATWKSCTFSYPADFALSDENYPAGKFSWDTNYFNLVLKKPQNSWVSISGMSEDYNWGPVIGGNADYQKSMRLYEVVEKKKTDYKRSFPGFFIQNEIKRDDGGVILEYIDENTKTYEVIKEVENVVRFLRISADNQVWNTNREVFEGIIESIKC